VGVLCLLAGTPLGRCAAPLPPLCLALFEWVSLPQAGVLNFGIKPISNEFSRTFSSSLVTGLYEVNKCLFLGFQLYLIF